MTTTRSGPIVVLSSNADCFEEARSSAPPGVLVVLTLQDCIALSELRADEIEAIADVEHVSEMIAAEIGSYLMHLPNGERRVRALIHEDLEKARADGDLLRAAKLRLCLKHFVAAHAQGCGSRHG
jgi:hypothetical protein